MGGRLFRKMFESEISKNKKKKFGLETVFVLIFRFQDNKKVSGKHNKKNIFSILSLLGVILQRLCSRQAPHVGSIQVAYILGFPTFVRRRRKNSPNLSSPSPNVRRDKISRSGEPLTLTLGLMLL